MAVKEYRPNLQEDFAIFRYKNIIEEELKESDMRNAEATGIDCSMLILFQSKFVIFNSCIEKTVLLYVDFWGELLEENPDIKKLQSLASKITNILQESENQFIGLSDINPNNIKVLENYGYF